jgi:hypothetical protein
MKKMLSQLVWLAHCLLRELSACEIDFAINFRTCAVTTTEDVSAIAA